jgi:hypothetical protein
MAQTEVGIVFKAYDQTSRQLGLIGSGLDRFKRQLVGLGVGFLSARAIVSGLEGIGRAAMADETALSNLSASVGSQSRALADYAKQLATISHYSAGQIMEEMAAAKNMGVVTDQLDEVTTAAIGLAKAYRMDLSEAVQMVAKAAEGETGSLKRRGIILDENLTAQEKFNALLQIGYAKVHLETESINTATGAQQQFRKELETFKGALGQSFLEPLKETYQALTKEMREHQSETAKFVKQQVEGLLAIWEAADWVRKQLSKELMPQSYYNLAQEEYRQTLGSLDPNAFLLRPGERDVGGMEVTPPNYDAKYRQILDRYKGQWEKDQYTITNAGAQRLRDAANNLANPPTNLPLSGGSGKEEEALQRDRLSLYRQLSSGLRKTDDEYFTAKFALLEEEKDRFLTGIAKEKDDYAQFTKDRALLDKWYADQKHQLDIEQAKSSEDFFAGWDAGVMEMKADLQTLGELGAESAKLVRDAWVSGTWDMIAAGRSAGDVFRSLMLDWAKMAYTNTMNRFATQGMSWLGGLFGGGGTIPAGDINPGMANVAHAGGLVGYDAFPRRSVAAGLFAGAPRLHGGLRSGEFPAILERGEQVVPRGGSSRTTDQLLRQLIGAVREGQRIYLVDDTGVVKRELQRMNDTRSVLMR